MKPRIVLEKEGRRATVTESLKFRGEVVTLYGYNDYHKKYRKIQSRYFGGLPSKRAENAAKAWVDKLEYLKAR